MKEIGGYFELELNKGVDYHPNAVKLNTGRNCLEYILKVREYKKIYIPFFTCEVILEPINKLGLDYEFYSINQDLEPNFDKTLKSEEGFLYTNYFGLKSVKAKELSLSMRNLIVDNSQAFFEKPIENIDTFYSARKFLGVPDGAYVYINKRLDEILEQDYSMHRMSHLLGRIDENAEQFYSQFKANDDSLSQNSIKLMSKLTNRLLQSVNYEEISAQRKVNFDFVHSNLRNKNKLNIQFSSKSTPMVYPYWVNDARTIRKRLLEHKIYIPTYWPNVRFWTNNELETNLVENLLCLPIDQRYTIENLAYFIEIIENYE